MRSSIRETVPIISVVTPVYNSEKYLDEAIQSVLSQTFTEWELLLINDGSTDGSGELCDRYLNLDKRIRVFHIENGGYGRARNLGLDNAVGEWITFLDSDDYLAPCALQHMLDHAYDSDIVMSLYQTIPEQTMTKQTGVSRRFETFTEMRNEFTQLYESYFFLSVTSKLYRKNMLKNKFDVSNGSLISEWLFNFQLMPLCKGICFVPEFAYYYRSNDHISTCSHFHSEWLYISKSVYNTVIELFPNESEIVAFMSRRYISRVRQHLIAISFLKSVNRFQKIAMISAERMDSFYSLPSIVQADCAKSDEDIWKAFMEDSPENVLLIVERKVEKLLHQQKECVQDFK